MSVIFSGNTYQPGDDGRLYKAGTYVREDDSVMKPGGKIFYIDETGGEGATYTFYDSHGVEIPESAIAVGDEPYAYKITGTPNKPKYYVFYPNAVTSKTWTYQAEGSWVYNLLGTTDGIGAGKTNTDIVMAADDGAYVAWTNSIWHALKDMRDNSYGGQSDWHVGSKAELEALRLAVDCDGNPLTNLFATTYIWSSSENSAGYAWCWGYPGQCWDSLSKNLNLALLAVRAF